MSCLCMREWMCEQFCLSVVSLSDKLNEMCVGLCRRLLLVQYHELIFGVSYVRNDLLMICSISLRIQSSSIDWIFVSFQVYGSVNLGIQRFIQSFLFSAVLCDSHVTGPFTFTMRQELQMIQKKLHMLLSYWLALCMGMDCVLCLNLFSSKVDCIDSILHTHFRNGSRLHSQWRDIR